MQPGHDLRKDFISNEEYELLKRNFGYGCIKNHRSLFLTTLNCKMATINNLNKMNYIE